jgi:MFS family permease
MPDFSPAPPGFRFDQTHMDFRNILKFTGKFNPNKDTEQKFSQFWIKIVQYGSGKYLNEDEYISILKYTVYGVAITDLMSLIEGGNSLTEIVNGLAALYDDVETLDDFKHQAEYADSFVVKYSTIIMSISQISETLFILAIPFFLKKFGIKQVMLFSMIAWVLRFGLFAYGNPTDGLWMIIMSCIVYGMAFDFFNISGSLFVETSTDSTIRSSAQGLFMMMKRTKSSRGCM